MNKFISNDFISSIRKSFIFILFFYLVFFPADLVNIKEILLLINLLMCLPGIISNSFNNRLGLYLFLYATVFPLFQILYSITVGRIYSFEPFTAAYIWIYLLLPAAIVYYNVNIEKIIIILYQSLSFVIISIVFLDITGLLSYFENPIVIFFSNMKELRGGIGILSTFGYAVFFKTSPIIIFVFAYNLSNKRFFRTFLCTIAIALTGTRANLYVMLVLFFLIPTFAMKKDKVRIYVLVFLSLMTLLFLSQLVEYLKLRSSYKFDNSDLIKYAHLKSIMVFLKEAPYRYIFGSGVGSSFYSTGVSGYVSVVELSYIDYFRQIGIIGMIFFLFFLVLPMKFLFTHQAWTFYAYVGYLAIAFTNPLLISSTGFIVYVYIYSLYFQNYLSRGRYVYERHHSSRRSRNPALSSDHGN